MTDFMNDFMHYTQSDYTKMAWKNGGGTTFEIARQNSEHSDDFDWRISMADVAQDGAFSEFSGKQRLLAILTGNGLNLTINDNHQSLHTHQVLDFSGNDTVFARLIDGAIRDFNVIYNPKHYRASMHWLTLGDTISLKPTTFVIASQPSQFVLDGQSLALNRYDCLKINKNSTLTLQLGCACIAMITRISQLP